jgi:hypothetical protein
MLLRLAFLFVFGLALGGLGVSRAIEALTATDARPAATSTKKSARTLDARVLRAGERSRLPQTLSIQPR